MSRVQKTILLIVLALVALVILVAVVLRFDQTRQLLPFLALDQSGTKDNIQTQPGQVAVIDSNIIVTSPLSRDLIASPLEVSGRARILEDNISFRLKDDKENIITSGLTTAAPGPSGWAFFSGRLNFDYPSSQLGWLEVYTLNSKDNSEQNLIRLPIQFSDYQETEITIYFGNSELNVAQLDCSIVYPVQRKVAQSPKLPAIVLAELLNGPSEAEATQGYFTSLPTEGIEVQTLEFKDGSIYVDFNQALQEGVGGSCRVNAIRSQINSTLSQFSDTDQVIISIDGETEEILQP